jgi:hypothetical protein
MDNLQIYSQTLQSYASFYDAVGDYKSSDECTKFLVKISNIQDKNIRLSFNFLKTVGLQKPINYLIDQGKKLDKWIRANIPGGWITVVVIAAGAGAFGPQIKSQLLTFFNKGGKLEQLLNSNNPAERAIGKTLLDTATKKVQQTTQQLAQPGQNRSTNQAGVLAQPEQSTYPNLQMDVQQVYQQYLSNKSQTVPQMQAIINNKKTTIYNYMTGTMKATPQVAQQQAATFEKLVKSNLNSAGLKI